MCIRDRDEAGEHEISGDAGKALPDVALWRQRMIDDVELAGEYQVADDGKEREFRDHRPPELNELLRPDVPEPFNELQLSLDKGNVANGEAKERDHKQAESKYRVYEQRGNRCAVQLEGKRNNAGCNGDQHLEHAVDEMKHGNYRSVLRFEKKDLLQELHRSSRGEVAHANS